MIRFHEVIEKSVEAIRNAGGVDLKDREITLVRDIKGRVQIVLDAADKDDTELATRLSSRLKDDNNGLGAYFGGEVWYAKKKADVIHDGILKCVKEERAPFGPTGREHAVVVSAKQPAGQRTLVAPSSLAAPSTSVR